LSGLWLLMAGWLMARRAKGLDPYARRCNTDARQVRVSCRLGAQAQAEETLW
jgi:hypothetical protein